MFMLREGGDEHEHSRDYVTREAHFRNYCSIIAVGKGKLQSHNDDMDPLGEIQDQRGHERRTSSSKGTCPPFPIPTPVVEGCKGNEPRFSGSTLEDML